MEEELRHLPGVNRVYRGGGITIGWEPRLCIHVGSCFRLLPAVFDPNARPWVQLQAASNDEIASIVETCPTSALTYQRTDGGPQEQVDDTTTVQPRTNGPLFVRGPLEVVDARGNVIRRATRLALCRCGQSGNKPYCDLSHRAANFQS